MNYDDWKLEAPEYNENECLYCGEECENDFCDKECRKAHELDN